MADTVKTEQILKLEYYFVDGDTRTQVVNYGRSDVTTTEIRELQSLIRANNLLIGDKNQATFGKISAVTYTDRQTTTTDAERPLGVQTLADADKVIAYNRNNVSTTGYKLIDIVNDAVTVNYADLKAAGNGSTIGYYINPYALTYPLTVRVQGTLPINQTSSGGGAFLNTSNIANDWHYVLGTSMYLAADSQPGEYSCVFTITAGTRTLTVTIPDSPIAGITVDKSYTYQALSA